MIEASRLLFLTKPLPTYPSCKVMQPSLYQRSIIQHSHHVGNKRVLPCYFQRFFFSFCYISQYVRCNFHLSKTWRPVCIQFRNYSFCGLDRFCWRCNITVCNSGSHPEHSFLSHANKHWYTSIG